jgi:hypothetical protein
MVISLLPAPTRVNLILWLHRGGQVHSVALLRELLEGLGCRVRVIVTSRMQPGESIRADVNLFSSELHPAWLPLAGRNVLIPNAEQDPRQSSTPLLRPERFGETSDQLRFYRKADTLLVKTRAAAAAFASHGLAATYVGFASRDRFLADVPKDDAAGWLCVVGDNFGNKNLAPVLNVWQRNTDFPVLHVVVRRDCPLATPDLANVRYHRGHLGDDELRVMQNRCGVHVCPSVMEGWGHAIVEATSAAALVITTDAPPMNEHVTEERGALYATDNAKAPQPHGLAFKHAIDERALEWAVRRVMAMDVDDRLARGARARRYALDSAAEFRVNFAGEWQKIVESL